MDKNEEKKQFLSQTEHIVRQLVHLSFSLDTFLMSYELAKEYLNSFKTLSDIARTSFTKAILVDYAAAFISNEFDKGEKTIISTKYLTKSNSFNVDMHQALMELRHFLVAHASYENPNMVVNVAKFSNTQPETHRHEDLYIPIQFFLENTSMGFISNEDKIKEIIDHLETCKQLTFAKSGELVEHLKSCMIESAPVANALHAVRILEVNENQVSAVSETDYWGGNHKELELRFGRNNLQFFVTRLRIDRPFVGDYIGEGYRVREDATSGNITVSFLSK